VLAAAHAAETHGDADEFFEVLLANSPSGADAMSWA
jgi:hypothetical protein